ncbi:bifunctional hydroxymethylpyrimidine kinase/phosphomethylpyrimidine kinase [Poseidonibacter antarcticus]|uniref:bifunctional hydroxymethylpyrimidine kinase/phosphomethylpyrimidine kinase n=1 Tax=Poseidonibacter antarcticus TaxID=2478538 RepID=UPI000EF47C42|nr:bifunctional hydroxymethylpyrimidine kinase/phosphomethylpyrimidine kinase [Poseidonibacter antarcticus]
MKVVLSIAGSDCSGGAGIQADLKTFEAFGVFGCTVLTVLTAQNTTGVKSISTVEPSFVKEQLEMVFADFEVSAIKIGMLFSKEIINTVREFIKDLDIPIVLDPVFISKAGSMLLSDDAILNMKLLFDYVTILTPNQFEAKALFDYEDNNIEVIEEIRKLKCATIVKNHYENDKSIDTLYFDGKIRKYETPYIKSENTHGTGCSFSSAIAANLALGKNLDESIDISNKFIYQAIKNAPNLGKGKGPIAHKKGFECLNIE